MRDSSGNRDSRRSSNPGSHQSNDGRTARPNRFDKRSDANRSTRAVPGRQSTSSADTGKRKTAQSAFSSRSGSRKESSAKRSSSFGSKSESENSDLANSNWKTVPRHYNYRKRPVKAAALAEVTPPSGRRSQADTQRALQKVNAQAERRAGKKPSKRSQAREQISDFIGLFDTLLKRRVALAIAAIIVLVVGFSIVDGIGSFGKIHASVSVAGVDIGSLTKEQAVQKLEQQLNPVVTGKPVDLFADDQAKKSGVTEDTQTIKGGVTTYNTDEQVQAGYHSWRLSAATVEAFIDSEYLVEEAYAIGRGADFLPGRLAATIFGVDLPGRLTYDEVQIDALEKLLTNSIGTTMNNASITFSDGSFSTVDGNDGQSVEHERFVALLDQAFLGSDRSVIIPIAAEPMEIDLVKASQAAEKAQEAIGTPIAMVYEEGSDSWELSSETLGSWISTTVVVDGSEAELVPRIDPQKIKEGISAIIGDLNPGIPPINARFKVVEGELTIIPGEPGTGIDFTSVADNLNAIMFGEGDAIRKINLAISTLQPDVTTEMAQAMNIKDKIASFSTEFPYASNARITNIQLVSDLLNNSLLAPGAVWSFNETAGECTADRGFQEAKAIVGDEYVDEIGGGICQVATTIYITAFNAGFPIVERTNHSQYIASYPDGLDAAVSWPGLDFKFQNDTTDYLLLTMEYTDSSVTATLWGTNPGYTVELDKGEWMEGDSFQTREVNNPDLPIGEKKVKTKGKNGSVIKVTRYVYDRNGELIRDATFRSAYEPVDEVIEIGTKKPE